MQPFIDFVDDLGRKLTELTTADLVVGESISLGKHTLVPIADSSFGIGAAGGEGEGMHPRGKGQTKTTSGQGASIGGGLGTRIRPVAVVVFGEEGVEVLRLPAPKGPVEKLLDSLPALVEKVKAVAEDCCPPDK